jgi:hypothetical protein
MHEIMSEKFYLSSKFGTLFNKSGFTISELLHFSPLKKNLVPEIHSLRTEKIGEFFLKVIFSFPSSFIFGVITPLNFQKLDASGSSGSISFLEDTDRYFTIGQILVDVHRTVINILEDFGLLRNFKTFPK